MKRKITPLYYLLIVLLLVSIVSSQRPLPEGVTEVTECTTQQYEENIPIIAKCMKPYMGSVCSDSPVNKSCTQQLMHKAYPCIDGYQTRTRSKQNCQVVAYNINNQVKINANEYTCTAQKNGAQFEVLCDSKYDGNGDGVCKSGESCMKFLVNGNSVQKLEKNSRNDFVANDESFVRKRAKAEVLQ